MNQMENDSVILEHLGDENEKYMGAVVPPVYLTSLHVFDTAEEYLNFDADVYKRQGGQSKAHVVTVGGLSLNSEAKELTVDGEIVRLTATEFKILELLMSNAGRVFSAEEIYRRVWNEDAYSVENTVMVHIRHIREKIEINPKEPKYLKVVWGIGYKVEKI